MQVGANVGPGEILWSADSQHVAFSGGKVFDRTGKLVLDPGQAFQLVWHPSGKSVAVNSATFGLRLLALDGTASEVGAPASSVPVGFLPDGRLLVYRAIYP